MRLRQPRRNFPPLRRRLFVATCAMVIIGLLSLSAADLYLRHEISRIKRVDVPLVSQGGPLDDDSGTVMNVLCIWLSETPSTVLALAV